MLSPVLYYCIIFQDPQQDSGSAGTKIILDASENDTKKNFQENIPGKKQFQKKWRNCIYVVFFHKLVLSSNKPLCLLKQPLVDTV